MNRVALVASSFHPHVGGVEEHVRQVAREFAARGIAVEVWTVDRGEHLGIREVGGITVRYLPAPLPARSVGAMTRFVWRFPPAWSRWRRAMREFRPDLLHVQCFGPNGLYALALHRRTGVPLAVTSHGETFADDASVFDKSALLRRGLRSALSRASIVTGCSAMVIDDLRTRFELSDGDVVANGVDLTIVPAAPLPGIDGRTFVTVGRLGRTKGFDLLLEALARTETAIDTRLVVIGDGPERGSLTKQSEQLGISHRVSFVGMLQSPQVAAAMASALAVVVPSRVESFGIVVLEAWRASAPLIVTRRVGAPVRDRIDAVVVDPEESATFARALDAVAADPVLRESIAAAGARRVEAFTWGAAAEGYLGLYARAEETEA
ncbi:glycosyltransferase family 4 protein [Microbacterium lacus]|uniref:glycosyltransferase family 4 protein n=1 Tax=Microbacterium lacus TaxID=415217 RepID=UPI0038500D41